MSSSPRPGRLARWWREAALVGLLYAAYDATRGLRHTELATADRNGARLLGWDRASHLSPEHPLNQLLWHVPVLAVLASYFYATLHFIVTPAVLIWLYRRHADEYRRARTVLMVATFIALIGFWVYPASPPRLLPGSGVHDTLADVHQWGWWSGPSSAPRGLGQLANELAAMPSLHMIWSLWAGVLIARHAKHRLVRALGISYPIFTAIVVMGTGNHYLIDVVVGIAVVGLAVLLANAGAQSIARIRAIRVTRLSRRQMSRLLGVAASVVLVLALARLLGSYLPSAGQTLWHPQLGWLAVAVGVELLSMSAFSELQRTTLRASGTRVGVGAMLGLTFEANAISESLPAGSAFATGYSFRRFRTWGASTPGAGYTLLVSGLVSTVSFGLLAALAAGIASGLSATPLPGVLTAVLLGAILFGVRQIRLHPEAATRLLERSMTTFNRIRRQPASTDQSRLLALVNQASGIRYEARGWSAALTYASINWACDLACLLAAGRAVNLSGATTGLAVLAYIAGMSVSSLSLVPGGLGLVEAAMILTLSHGGVPHSAAIATVLLYRLVSYAIMAAIGWLLCLAHTGRGNRSTVAAPDPAEVQTTAIGELTIHEIDNRRGRAARTPEQKLRPTLSTSR